MAVQTLKPAPRAADTKAEAAKARAVLDQMFAYFDAEDLRPLPEAEWPAAA